MNAYKPEVREQEGTSETRNPEEIRNEIDKTRNRLSNRIDEIQNRLNPENLKQQAQDAVESAITDGVDSVQEYVNDYVQQLNWPTLRDNLVGSVRRNPIPSALIGIGLGWILLEGMTGSSSRSARAAWSNEPNGHEYDANPSYGWQEAAPSSSRAGDYARYQPSSSPSHYGDANDSTTEQLKEKASNLAGQVSEKAGQIKEAVQQQASNVAERVTEGVNTVMGEWEQAGDYATEWSQQAQDQVKYAGEQARRSLDQNPVLFGAVALAVGAGLGMLLPATNYENQALGELRDQTVQKAQSAVDEVKQRAQTVLEEVRPDLEQATSHVVEHLKQTGKEAVGEVRQSLQNASEKLDQKANEQAGAGFDTKPATKEAQFT